MDPVAQPSAAAAAERPSRPRLGIAITEIGIPSEIWAGRQALGMTRFDPVLLSWSRHAPAPVWGAEIETRMIEGPFPGRRGLVRRVAGRAGHPAALLPDAREAAAIRAAVAEARVDAVLCHFAWTAIPVAAALGGALPVIAHVHGRDVSALMADRAYLRALARTLPRLDGLVAVGHFQIDRLRPLGLPARHAVIPCGAPVAQFAARPLPERAEGAPLRLVSVGRISAEKGVMETLAAVERAAALGLDLTWTCIGDGPLSGDLARAVTAGPVAERVTLPGRLPPAEIAEILSRSHVFLQHSRPHGGWIEGFGVSLTEAGAAGLPLVASRLGGIPDQLGDGVNGILHAPDDIAGQAAAIGLLGRDEALRRRMGAEARRVAAGFDTGTMTARLEALLAEALAARSGERP